MDLMVSYVVVKSKHGVATLLQRFVAIPELESWSFARCVVPIFYIIYLFDLKFPRLNIFLNAVFKFQNDILSK